MSANSDDQPVLRDWLAVLARQKWIVLLALIGVPLLAFVASRTEQRLYRASATVLVNQQNPTTAEALNLTAAASSPPDRYAATQASLARVDTVAKMAVRAAGRPHRSAASLLANSSVSADPTTDLLTFSVTDPSPAVATKLANVYAGQFAAFRHRLDTQALVAAMSDTQRKQAELASSGDARSLLYRRLAATERNLEKLQTLQAAGSSAELVGTAGDASLVQPRTGRNVLLGIIAGLALGIALAFLRNSLDSRAQSGGELRERLGVPLLGQVPRPGSRLAPSEQLATLWRPSSSSSEAFRILKNNIENSQLEHHADSIAITSAGAGDGKSATAANLAVTLARSGRRVILVELDLRRPRLARLFGLDESPGLTSLASGGKLAGAISVVDVRSDRRGRDAGALRVVTAGRPLADPGEFLLSRYVPQTLTALKKRCDVLLIDTPPLLAAGDAMTVAVHTDALIVVAGVNRVRRATLAEVRRSLEGCPTFTLGAIATGPGVMEGQRLRDQLRPSLARRRSSGVWRERFAAARHGAHVGESSKEMLATISASVGAIASGGARRSAGTDANGRESRQEEPEAGNGRSAPNGQRVPGA